MNRVYLDYASATPVDKRVLRAMEPYFTDDFYNPLAVYSLARQAKQDLAAAKKVIAAHLGVTHAELIMTSGGSEANNLAIRGVMYKFPGKTVLVSSIEHESVIKPAERYKAEFIGVDKRGMIKLDQLDNVGDDVVLVSVMLANNEVGAVQPISKIAEKLRELRRDRQKRKIDLPLYFHTDAAQAPLYLDVNAHRLGVDFMSLNGGKIYGPKQTGVLFAAKHTVLEPQILGGGQQRGMRSGSESTAQAVGLAKALDLASASRAKEIKRLSEIQKYFIGGLMKIDKNITINGPDKNRLPSNVHATFPGADNERLLFQLDEAGIMAASGSACGAASVEPSHVLRALGLSDTEARSSLRFSLGRETTKADIEYTLQTLDKILA
ncbi:cysteine desulfurase [Candidatus Parcubacteria bacterium]|nr:cysteine desulfurase [Candidatus Parcubacteria bacterium]